MPKNATCLGNYSIVSVMTQGEVSTYHAGVDVMLFKGKNVAFSKEWCSLSYAASYRHYVYLALPGPNSK